MSATTMKPPEIAPMIPAATASTPPPITARKDGSESTAASWSIAVPRPTCAFRGKREEPLRLRHLVERLRDGLEELDDLREHRRDDEDEERRHEQGERSEDDADAGAALHVVPLEQPHDRVEPEREEEREDDVDEDRRDRQQRAAEHQGAEHAEGRGEAARKRPVDRGEDARAERVLVRHRGASRSAARAAAPSAGRGNGCGAAAADDGESLMAPL